MRLTFVVEVKEDDHAVKATKKLLNELGGDVAEAICAHEKIEGNAVECVIARED